MYTSKSNIVICKKACGFCNNWKEPIAGENLTEIEMFNAAEERICRIYGIKKKAAACCRNFEFHGNMTIQL